jgi:hypothetical protein
MRYMTSDDIAARLRLYANASIEGSWSAVFRLDLNIAADQIERLRIERDEARRMVCGLDADLMEDQREYARNRGWDCFDLVPNDIEAHEVRGDVAGPEGAD